MKLSTKLALFNAGSKIAILLLFALLLPWLVRHFAITSTDERLQRQQETVLTIIAEQGIGSFLQEGDEGGYGSYNILKEEFISLEQIEPEETVHSIEDAQRAVEGEVVDYRVLSYTFTIDEEYYLLEIGRSTTTIAEISRTLQRFSFYLMFVVILVTFITDSAFAQALLKPLKKIIKTKLQHIQYPTSPPYPVIKTSTTDFQLLDSSINQMMTQIDSAFRKEREFISNVSHELLTPVSVMQHRLENILQEKNLSQESMRKIVESQKTLNRLKNIINSLLFISKIENEQYGREEAVSVRELVQEVVEEAIDRAEAKELRLCVQLEEDYVQNHANKALLFTMLFNIVNNAIKYSPPGGAIAIKGRPLEKGYQLQVLDKGEGISEQKLERIFNRFERFHKPDGESYGLGLSIVKIIADFHHLSLQVSSQEDEGTTFSIDFN
ncbi:sensor histidine kinase [Pontibacter virosus]|uniref:histidine kinase n=1 Tax=Pontibacter virosus TaxID=1765052 RepID=A0A2U1AZ46_9BACT|nr:HAMP domain-containing sensor histidine kinase [Pontibacter virosus]PVY41683.1 signal transduction histidine kinase [Pontibacter virosus]